jgi:enoyl-CoA hydratase/carnithine racemase
MSEHVLDFEKEGPIAILRLNRPDRLNAMNTRLLTELTEAVKEIRRDDEIRVYLVTGAPRTDGRPCFSAGDDLKEAEEGGLPSGNPGGRLTNLIDDLWKPSIAVIDGVCTTGALEIAMACHLRVAGETAQISDWHLKRLGSGIGGWGASTRLARLVGLSNAREMILTGRVVDGAEAVRIGLANRVASSDRLWGEAMDMARAIAEMSPHGVRTTQAHLARTMDLSKEESLGYARQVREMLMPGRTFEDAAKGVLGSRSERT